MKLIKKFLLSTMLIIALLLSACMGSSPKEAPRPSFTKETYPKVDGSTATIPLSEAFAENLLGITSKEAAIYIKHNTTHNAYVNLIDNKADIIFVTEPSNEELALAKKANVELEVVPVVKEAFVFLVNTKNPITSLKTKQLQDIYQGKITNWSQVGGENNEVIAYQREANSGSQTLMEQTVMKGLKMINAPKYVVPGMEGLIEKIAKYDNAENALGYSVYYYAKTMFNKDTIKFIAIDGIVPDSKSISTGKYPFTSAYYAVIKKTDSETAASRKLLNWVLGKDGQELAEKTGYIQLKVR
jgi:phosphate transport system substrate-binding protein